MNVTQGQTFVTGVTIINLDKFNICVATLEIFSTL